MGRVFEVTLEGLIYSCKHCGTHLALSDDVVSKNLELGTAKQYFVLYYVLDLMYYLEIWHCDFCNGSNGETLEKLLIEDPRHGKAYLFSKVVNVTLGEKEERAMMTGSHTVADIFCVRCGSIVGWKYETAHEKSQKYKEGKSVLERFKISGPDGSHYWMSHEAHVGGSDTDDV
ncbi:hypothetical protein DH2020_010372 [Rehmannia glutinosa]|uniref:Yippee domain-containing protein n=1 Tax=Rehmannia glutinosa TaxID=99300 RepID=A0ABR0XAF8_REHGL